MKIHWLEWLGGDHRENEHDYPRCPRCTKLTVHFMELPRNANGITFRVCQTCWVKDHNERRQRMAVDDPVKELTGNILLTANTTSTAINCISEARALVIAERAWLYLRLRGYVSTPAERELLDVVIRDLQPGKCVSIYELNPVFDAVRKVLAERAPKPPDPRPRFILGGGPMFPKYVDSFTGKDLEHQEVLSLLNAQEPK